MRGRSRAAGSARSRASSCHSFRVSVVSSIRWGKTGLEKIGYVLLAIVAAIWLLAMVAGMIAAFPFGIVGLIAIVGVGFLFAKVIQDRLSNKEDDHYQRTVDK